MRKGDDEITVEARAGDRRAPSSAGKAVSEAETIEEEKRAVGAWPAPPPSAVTPLHGPLDAVVDGRQVSETERVVVLPDGSVERRLDRVEDGVARRARLFDPVWPALLVLLLLVALAAAAAWYFTRADTRAVPTVTGMRVDDAVERLQSEGFETQIERTRHADSRDLVYAQDPSPGARVDEGTTVTVRVSAGSAPTRRLPNAVGLKEVAARDRLVQAGVRVNVVRVAASAPAGVVTRQDPAPGTPTSADTTVTLTVSRGARATTKVVPALTGMTVDDAVGELRAAGFESSIRRTSDEAPIDQVVGQRPRAGADLDTGRTVTVVVSSGPAQVEVPLAVGLQEADARQRLARAGLQVTVVEQFSADVPRGDVLAQRPSAGARTTKDAPVRLTVSKGAETAAVPNVVGYDVNSAQAAVTNAGFEANVARVPSSEPEGTVVAQHPTGGTAEKGSFVRLNVSTGTPR